MMKIFSAALALTFLLTPATTGFAQETTAPAEVTVEETEEARKAREKIERRIERRKQRKARRARCDSASTGRICR